MLFIEGRVRGKVIKFLINLYESSKLKHPSSWRILDSSEISIISPGKMFD